MILDYICNITSDIEPGTASGKDLKMIFTMEDGTEHIIILPTSGALIIKDDE